MRIPLYLYVILGAMASQAAAQTVVPLWDGPAPKSLGSAPEDIPSITVFLPAKAAGNIPGIVIYPGGGYGQLTGGEGAPIAKWFQAKGVAAFVVKYRLPTDGYMHPVPMLDAQRAIRLVRSRAAEWNVDQAKIGVIGFSAGGHVASTVETHFDAGDLKATDPIDQVSSRPDFAVLVYAVIDMKESFAHSASRMHLFGPHPDPALLASFSNETQVTAQTPPTILVHAQDDHHVLIQNSRVMYAALQAAGVPSALQEYPHGDHGFALGKKAPPGWLDKVYDWLKGQGLML